VVTKLRNFEAELTAMVDETEAYYNEDSGYRPLERRTGGAQASPDNGADFSPQQRTKAQELARNPKFKSLPVGSPGRPFAPRSQAEFNSIKPGQYYIDDDGQVYPKRR
jgi:hypothetical protein